MLRLVPLLLVILSACAPLPQTGPAMPPSGVLTPVGSDGSRSRAERAANTFIEVVETVEPVAESECRRVAPRANCNFIIVVDDRPGQQPNAYQTLDQAGRPILAFNLALIASVENADELAFVMGHEAAHHVLGHLERTQQNATVGALIFSNLAAASGASPDYIREAEQLGAQVGARRYSKDFELEADQLGTIITGKAGYNPVRGAEFFLRIPDPGNRFLGTHPPNASRIDIVRRTAAQMGAI
ncbi:MULTISPECIES: M48 family metallopeptidase [unclassified Roseivivax]|uniref:M48 family metallopeptidase n=1 Tax=Roseivivax sp. GX 12232 TaxID=2900547 RepID=UPI001E619D1A|nr:M48 family metallopeptidase [Roseivivax sp. GX 12232]MCE0506109.1 M48 family metallopeptidase [Roseivivax sp. GX 12232]